MTQINGVCQIITAITSYCQLQKITKDKRTFFILDLVYREEVVEVTTVITVHTVKTKLNCMGITHGVLLD